MMLRFRLFLDCMCVDLHVLFCFVWVLFWRLCFVGLSGCCLGGIAFFYYMDVVFAVYCCFVLWVCFAVSFSFCCMVAFVWAVSLFC